MNFARRLEEKLEPKCCLRHVSIDPIQMQLSIPSIDTQTDKHTRQYVNAIVVFFSKLFVCGHVDNNVLLPLREVFFYS